MRKQRLEFSSANFTFGIRRYTACERLVLEREKNDKGWKQLCQLSNSILRIWNFDVLLTVYLSIILVINQLNTQILVL